MSIIHSSLLIPLHGGAVTPAQIELTVFFLVGLLGGAHCLGMCGPLVTMYAKEMTPTQQSRNNVLTLYEVRQHALFNLGRTLSYATLGGLFGLAGALVFDVSATVTTLGSVVRATMGILVGAFIIVMGVRYVTGTHGSQSLLSSGPIGGLYQRFASRMEKWVGGPGILGLGLVHGLLPCPLLYPAFVYAFARGSPTGGAVALAVLGLGTFPTLFFYGTLVQSAGVTRREQLHRVLGIAFFLMGWMPLAHELAVFGIPVPHIELPVYQPLQV